MTTKVDFIIEINKSKDSFIAKCDCCGRKLKNSYICKQGSEEITLGKNCLFGSQEAINKYEKRMWVLKVKTSMWTKLVYADVLNNEEFAREILSRKNLLKT